MVGNLIIILLLILPAIICVFKLDVLLNISSKYVSQVKILFAFVFGSYFVSQMSSIFNIATFVKNKIYLNILVSSADALFKGLIYIILFSIFAPKVYFVGLVGFILAIVNLTIAWTFKKKLLPEIKFSKQDFSWKTVGELLSSGVWNTINQGSHILMTGLDLLVANLFIGPVEMGVLAVAKTIPATITSLASTINNSFAPGQTIAYSDKDEKSFLNSLKFSSSVSCVLVSIIIMTFCALAFDFYSLWQPTLNAKTLTILSVLTCCNLIPFCGTQTLYNVFTVKNKLKVNAISFFTTGMLSVFLTFILLKFTNLGLYAIAATSSILSILRNMFVTLPYTAKLLNLRWYKLYGEVFKSILCCLCVFIIGCALRFLILPQNWIVLILSILCTVIISLFINIFIILNKTQRRQLLNKIRRK